MCIAYLHHYVTGLGFQRGHDTSQAGYGQYYKMLALGAEKRTQNAVYAQVKQGVPVVRAYPRLGYPCEGEPSTRN